MELALETQQTAWYVFIYSSTASCGDFSALVANALFVSNRKINQRPKDLDNDQLLQIPLTKPPIKSITLKFPHGKEVVARNLKGLTIGDALSAIYKANKNRVSCSLTDPLSEFLANALAGG